MVIQAKMGGREALGRAGVWPVVLQVEASAGDGPHVLATGRTERSMAAYGAGRVLQVSHRVHVAGASGKVEGRAELDVDGWTGDVLRVRVRIGQGAERVEVERSGTFADHDAVLLGVALSLTRRAAALPAGRRALVSSAASGLERRCRKTLSAVRGALSSDGAAV